MHFANSVCATVLIYASVTRCSVGVARVLEDDDATNAAAGRAVVS